jgi:pimeloyl-ACP methyl ester carboxylesterase
VLVLAGDSDRTAPIESLHEMAKHFRDSELIEIPRGGHVMQLDRPGTVGRTLAEFFSRTLER